jgi:tetratricopeptide (TPR) repeat protein
LGHEDLAWPLLDKVVKLTRARGDGDDLVWVLNTLGDVKRRAGQWREAEAAYTEALDVAAIHAPARALIVRYNQALLHLQTGMWKRVDMGDEPVPWNEAFPVVVRLAWAASRRRRSLVERQLFRSESLLGSQPLADEDLLICPAGRCGTVHGCRLGNVGPALLAAGGGPGPRTEATE